MARRKIPYNKTATTHDVQISLLEEHGVTISDIDKTKEYLSDIGYYRLGFYLHPFEKTYPILDNRRQHNVKEGTTIEEVVALYYYDFDLRNILNRYLSRIEVAIRTAVIYELSNKYVNNNTWFVDSSVVKQDFINNFERAVYSFIRPKGPIQRHHRKYRGKYAPAWKTIEYMTLGNLEVLYENLLKDADKKIISLIFGEPATATFKSYLSAIREVRNACAHGNVLFGLTLTNGIRIGNACPSFTNNEHQTFAGALRVIDYILRKISTNRANDMWNDLKKATKDFSEKAPSIYPLVAQLTNISI